MTTPSPALERHSYYLEAIVSAQTLADLSSIRTEYTVDTVLNDWQKGVLKSRYEIREMQLKAMFTAPPGKAAHAYSLDNKERIAITHAQDDAKAFTTPVTPAVANEVFPDQGESSGSSKTFPAIEILTTNDSPVTVDTTNSTPNDIHPTPSVEVPQIANIIAPAFVAPVTPAIEQPTWSVWQVEPSEETVPKKRTRSPNKDRDEGAGSPWAKWTSSVTLSREIKLPIDGVQFSNNLFGITLTASTYEEAKAGIDEAFADFTNSTKLLSKDHVDKAYAQWLADWESKAKVEGIKNKLVIAPAVKAVYKDNLERSRAMILQLCAAFPEAKTFAQEFAKLNPIIQEQSIV